MNDKVAICLDAGCGCQSLNLGDTPMHFSAVAASCALSS